MRLAFLIFGSIVLKKFSAESLRGISHSQFHTTQTTAILGQVRNLSPSEPLRNDHYERQETARLAALNAGELSPLSSLEQFPSGTGLETTDRRRSPVFIVEVRTAEENCSSLLNGLNSPAFRAASRAVSCLS